MRVLFLLTALLGLSVQHAYSQGASNPNPIYVTVAPAGACSSAYQPLRYVIGSGGIYGCVGGTWALLNNAGGGGLTNPGTNGVVLCGGTACSVVSAGPLSGDVTSSGLTTTIANNAVTNAKILNATIDLTAKVTNVLPVANGGTGNASTTAYAVQLGGTTSTGAHQAVSGLGTAGQVLMSNGAGAAPTWQNAPGSGTVTSVGWTGGIVSIANPTSTPAFTIAGTSGGIPYFSSSSAWASSGALTANLPVIGGGAGAAPTVGTRSGTTTGFVTFTGAVGTVGNCPQWDASGNLTAGGACSGGSGYNLIQNNGTPVTARTTLNFINGGCVDNSGAASTDCTFTGSGASSYNDLTNWAPVRTSSTVLTFGSCSLAKPCVLSQGGKTANFTSSPTLTITGGTGAAYIAADYTGTTPVLKAYLNGITATWANCSGCTTGSGTGAPDDTEHQQFSDWTAGVSTVWDTNGWTDHRPQGLHRDVYLPGFGMSTFTTLNGRTTIPFDPTQLVSHCEIPFGDGQNVVTSTEPPAANLCKNKTGRTLTILGVECWVHEGSGTTVRPIITGGASNSILSSALTCSTSTGTGTLNGTPTLASNDSIDFLGNLSPDGTTKSGVVRVWTTF